MRITRRKKYFLGEFAAIEAALKCRNFLALYPIYIKELKNNTAETTMNSIPYIFTYLFLRFSSQ